MTLPQGHLSRLSGLSCHGARRPAAFVTGVAALWLPGAVLAVPHGAWVQAGWVAWCAACGIWLYRRRPARPVEPPAAGIDAPAEPAVPPGASLVQPLPMPACIIDLPGGTMCEVNGAFAGLLDEAADTLAGRSFVGFCLTPQDKLRISQLLADGRGADGLELPLRRRDGSVRWVSAAARPVDPDRLQQMLLIAHDITAQMQVQRSLTASEERFRVLLGALSEAVVLYDAKGGMLTSNRTSEDCSWLDAAHACLTDRPRRGCTTSMGMHWRGPCIRSPVRWPMACRRVTW